MAAQQLAKHAKLSSKRKVDRLLQPVGSERFANTRHGGQVRRFSVPWWPGSCVNPDDLLCVFPKAWRGFFR